MFYGSTAWFIYNDGITDEAWWGVGGAMLAFSALYTSTVAYLRVRSGWHYNSDVIIGGAAGTLIGILVPFVSQKIWPESFTADSRNPTGETAAVQQAFSYTGEL